MSRPSMELLSLFVAPGSSESLDSDTLVKGHGANSNDGSLRLPPIAITAVPDLALDVYPPKDIASVSKGLLNISRQIVNLEEHGSKPPSAIDYDADNVSSQHPSPQRANIRRQRTQPTKSAAFTFVQMKTADGKRDWAAESQVRSHAAKRLQEQRRQKQGLRAEPPAPSGHHHHTYHVLEISRPHILPPSPPPSDDDTCVHKRQTGSRVVGHMRCGECDGMEVFIDSDGGLDVRYLSGFKNRFGQAGLDPFGQLATSMTHRMHELLSYWIFDHSAKNVPMIYGKRNVSKLSIQHELQDAMEDDAAPHAISAAVAFQQAALIQRNDSLFDSCAVTKARLRQEEALKHLQTAIQKITVRLKNHELTLSNNTVMTVARLAVASAFGGDLKAHKAHLNGFIKLVQLRGGINTFPRRTAHHLSRTESNSAWLHKETPKLPMYDFTTHIDTLVAGSPFPDRVLHDFLWTPLYRAAVDMQSISRLIDERQASGPDAPLPPDKMAWAEDTFAATQHRLVSFPHPHQQIVPSVAYSRQNCWRCAAVIYFNTVIRTFPSTGLIKVAVERLIESLERSEPWTRWAPYEEVLLWVLFMGVVGSETRAEKGLFTLDFRRVVREMDVGVEGSGMGWEEVSGLLRQQVWRERPLVGMVREILQ